MSLTIAIAIAVSCSAFVVVVGVVGTIVWLRLRQERLSLAIANARGRHGRGLQNYAMDTITELSHEEGRTLRQYGQLPYGSPAEWGILGSRETFQQPATPSESTPRINEKPRSLHRSLTFSFSKPKSQSKLLRKKSTLGSLKSLTLPAKKDAPADTPDPKEDVLLSPIEGVLELPTVMTPRQSRERQDDETSDRSVTPWPVIPQRQPESLCPVLEDQDENEQRTPRVRGGSITTKSAGTVPARPAPPPPVAYPPNRFTLLRNDSALRLSSLSLDTAESSIFDDGVRTTTVDGEPSSPPLPPCPSYAPYGPDDVGRNFNRDSFPASKASLSQFPTYLSNSTLDTIYFEQGNASPRRSQTARHPSQATNPASHSPRRSESLSTNRHGRDSNIGLPSMPPRPDSALLPHFSQLQHTQPGAHVVRGPSHRSQNSREIPPMTANLFAQDIAPKGQRPLHSASRGRGSRKGHRRQNCVRISIHPQFTFESSQFPPAFEEPEKGKVQDEHTADIINLSTSNNPSPASKTPPAPTNIQRRPSAALDSHYSPVTPTKKRKHSLSEGDPFASVDSNTLPSIFTTLPSSDGSLTYTPSPERVIPIWPTRCHRSPTVHETPSMGSPRRSAVKGPRSQPVKKNHSVHKSSGLYRDPTIPTTPNAKSGLPRPVEQAESKDAQYQPKYIPYRAEQPENNHKPRHTQTSPGPKKTPNNSNQSSITIWEDVDLRDSPTKKSPGLQSTVVEVETPSPRRLQRHKSVAHPKRAARKSICRSPRQNFASPTRAGIGLGIANATPGSLYDHDGFYRG